MAKFLFLCNIHHGTYRNIKFKCLKFNQYTEILKQYFKVFSFGFVKWGGFQTPKGSPFCVVILYSAMVHPALITQFPSRYAITPSISTPYTSMFWVPLNFHMVHVLSLKFSKLLIGHEFQLQSGKWGLGRGSS